MENDAHMALSASDRRTRDHSNAGLKVARARSRVSGWSPALDDEDLAAAKIRLRGPTITVEEVARRLKVAPSTLYRHLPGGRSALDDDPADSRS